MASHYSESNAAPTLALLSLAHRNHRGDNLLHVCAQSNNDQLLIKILKSKVATDPSLTDAVNCRSAFA